MLVLGTHNAHKSRELEEMLTPHGVQVATLKEFPDAITVVEDGETFGENARLKAVQQAKHLGQWVLADDSGIAVDALDGAPGIFSARFASVELAGTLEGDAANNRLLLEKLAHTPTGRRGAHYVCAVVLADPTGAVRAAEQGRCGGRIVTEPRGDNGFGYDPIFEVREYHRTFGELGPEVKRALSHRSRAIRAIVPQIARLLRDATPAV